MAIVPCLPVLLCDEGRGVEAEAGAVSSSFELPLRAEQTARTVRVVGSAYTEPNVRVEGVRVSRALGDG